MPQPQPCTHWHAASSRHAHLSVPRPALAAQLGLNMAAGQISILDIEKRRNPHLPKLVWRQQRTHIMTQQWQASTFMTTVRMQGDPDAPWQAEPSPGECLDRARAAARKLLAARQDSLAMWAAYAALEQQAGGIKVQALTQAQALLSMLVVSRFTRNQP